MLNEKDSFEWFSKVAAWTEYELADLCLGRVPLLSSADSDERNKVLEYIHRATEFGELSRNTNSLAALSLSQYRSTTYYQRAEATVWAARNFPETFPFKPETLGATVSTTKPKWPWGDYETELLRKLEAAVDRFWTLYDPADNTTAPTNRQVIEWLKQQGVADRTAEVMATILRADGIPTGPRK